MKDLHELDPYRLKGEELRIYGMAGDSKNGFFKVFVNGHSFFCVASCGGGWDHVSISPFHQKRCPTWDEMCAIKTMFFGPEETVIQYHPPESSYVNIHPYCLHLWKPNNGTEIPMPPVAFV